LAGKPLIAYYIEAAVKSRYIDRVVVSTEDKEIAEISKNRKDYILQNLKDIDTTIEERSWLK
jgi:CMP-N-acetylneuraminic acid synthetase